MECLFGLICERTRHREIETRPRSICGLVCTEQVVTTRPVAPSADKYYSTAVEISLVQYIYITIYAILRIVYWDTSSPVMNILSNILYSFNFVTNLITGAAFRQCYLLIAARPMLGQYRRPALRYTDTSLCPHGQFHSALTSRTVVRPLATVDRLCTML